LASELAAEGAVEEDGYQSFQFLQDVLGTLLELGAAHKRRQEVDLPHIFRQWNFERKEGFGAEALPASPYTSPERGQRDPATTIRPSVIVTCSLRRCGSSSHPARCSFGTTHLRQVSASLLTIEP